MKCQNFQWKVSFTAKAKEFHDMQTRKKSFIHEEKDRGKHIE